MDSLSKDRVGRPGKRWSYLGHSPKGASVPLAFVRMKDGVE